MHDNKLLGLRSRAARWHIFKPKIQIWVNSGRFCNGKCLFILLPLGHFSRRFVYLMAIWYILWSFGIFSRFGMLYEETSGNTASKPQVFREC
jgi:hypothetical protein